MRGTLGLRSYPALFLPQLVKRDALMFRKVGVLGCQGMLEIFEKHFTELSGDLRWLIEQEIIFEPKLGVLNKSDLLDAETKVVLSDSWKIINRYEEEIEQPSFVEKLKGKENLLKGLKANKRKKQIEHYKGGVKGMLSGDLLLRPLSVYYRNVHNIDALPLLYADYPELDQQTAGLENVVDIIINQLPIPDDSTSWEQILNFRDDPNTEKKFLGLRNWMNEVARAKLTPLEIEQKLEWLLQEYREHMKVHRMKTNASTLETIVVSIAEFAEDLTKLKFGKLAKVPFSIRHRKIALLEAEAKAPGREIAFISKVKETFR